MLYFFCSIWLIYFHECLIINIGYIFFLHNIYNIKVIDQITKYYKIFNPVFLFALYIFFCSLSIWYI